MCIGSEAEYRDAAGRRPGERGFVPPIVDDIETVTRAVKAAGLDAGYDADYRDAEGRAPGEPDFVPPTSDPLLQIARVMPKRLLNDWV